MERHRLTRFEAMLLIIGAPAIIAAYAAMYIAGPWIPETASIEAVGWILYPLIDLSFPAAFLLIWAAGSLSLFVGVSVSHPHLVRN